MLRGKRQHRRELILYLLRFRQDNKVYKYAMNSQKNTKSYHKTEV